jgi:hypothetical protein
VKSAFDPIVDIPELTAPEVKCLTHRPSVITGNLATGTGIGGTFQERRVFYSDELRVVSRSLALLVVEHQNQLRQTIMILYSNHRTPSIGLT